MSIAYGENGDPLTPAEVKALRALNRLATQWPQTLTLVSMGGSLHVVHTSDKRFDGENSNMVRVEAVLASVDGIPNDGGDW